MESSFAYLMKSFSCTPNGHLLTKDLQRHSRPTRLVSLNLLFGERGEVVGRLQIEYVNSPRRKWENSLFLVQSRFCFTFFFTATAERKWGGTTSQLVLLGKIVTSLLAASILRGFPASGSLERVIIKLLCCYFPLRDSDLRRGFFFEDSWQNVLHW